jgi:hypothetical protein
MAYGCCHTPTRSIRYYLIFVLQGGRHLAENGRIPTRTTNEYDAAVPSACRAGSFQ